MKHTLPAAFAALILFSAAAQAAPAATAPAAKAAPAPAAKGEPAPLTYYNYAHNEAEYSVMLPEAPLVRTIWEEGADTRKILQLPPTDSSFIGEMATFNRVDVDTEDTYKVKITFLRARTEFLDTLSENRIKGMLETLAKETPLQNETFHYSGGDTALKWGTLGGFTTDQNQHPAYAAFHYLTGQESILVIEALYSVENPAFQEYYKTMVDNIKYNAP